MNRLTVILLLLAARIAGAATVVGDWPFDRTADGVAVADGQGVLEEATAGLFDASGNYGMGQAHHYSGVAIPGPVTAALYSTWKPGSSRGKDGCGLDTSCGGVYFLDGASELRARTNFSVWARVKILTTGESGTGIIMGRVGAWLVCRTKGRLAVGVSDANGSPDGTAIHDIFAGTGPFLEIGKWCDIGLSLAGDTAAGGQIKVYLDGALVKQAAEKSIPGGDAPFQIGGRGVQVSYSDSKALFDRVIFYEGVLESKDFVRLTRGGGPDIADRPVVVEPLSPRFYWDASGGIGRASGYKPLSWNPKSAAYEIPGDGDEVRGELKNQRELFQTVLAPQRGRYGAASVVPGGTNHHLIASYFIPEGYDRERRKVTGAIHLHLGKGEEAPGARLELRVYVNDDLKLRQTIFAQKDVPTFSAEVGKLAAGDRVYVAFGPDSLGDAGEFWFDYKVDIQMSGAQPLATSYPVAEAFRVDTTEPLEENNGWTTYHYQLSALARTNRIDLLFLGDSVTAGWAWNGKAVWDKRLLRYHPGNFGISGEGTQDVLWRLSHGELDGARPEAIVLMIGSNDINWPAKDIVAGVSEVVRQLRVGLPDSQLILCGILPRGELPNTPERMKILEANAELAKLDDGRQVHYVYFGDKLLLPDGRMPKELVPDFLHPVERGYDLWVDAIQPKLDQIFSGQSR